MCEPTLTYVLKVQKNGSTMDDLYAVVEMKKDLASDLLEKIQRFWQEDEDKETPNEMRYDSLTVGWVKADVLDPVLARTQSALGECMMNEAISLYDRAVVVDDPLNNIPMVPDVDCETLHVYPNCVKWHAFVGGASFQTVTESIPACHLEAIANGDPLKFLRPEVRAEHAQYIKDWVGWDVHASNDHHGTYWITEIDKATNPDLGGEENVEKVDRRVRQFIQASPKLYVACQEMLDWIAQARNGTLNDMESAMGRKCPDEEMRRACEEAV